MADESFQIATETALAGELSRLGGGNIPAEIHFAAQLARELYGNVRRADLGTVTGRILRSCVFDVFEILRRHCPDEQMLVHMCFVNRHGIEACDGRKITPSTIRIWDGLDELQPQSKYKNDWTGQITPAYLLEGLNDTAALNEQVRSFRCFAESYFAATGSFVARLPKTVEETEIIFLRSRNQVEEKFNPANGWEDQNELDNAVLAFSKFVLKKFAILYPNDVSTRSLFLISVGSHLFPWGDPRRAGASHAEWRTAPPVQAVWVVLSLPIQSLNSLTLPALWRAISEIDSAMSQSLAFDYAVEKSDALERVQRDARELKRIRNVIESAAKSYSQFSDRVADVFRTVQPPNTILADLANNLDFSLFTSPGVSFESVAKPGEKPRGVHWLNEDDLKHIGNEPIYALELEHRLKKFLSEDRMAAFRHHHPTCFEGLKFIKMHVYKVFANSKADECQAVQFGSVRAGLFWKCREPIGSLDIRPILSTKDRDVILNHREFIGALAGIAAAWLEPGDVDTQWIDVLVDIKPEGTTFKFFGGNSLRWTNEESLRSLVENIKSSLSKNADGGGDLKASLLRLLRSVGADFRVIAYQDEAEVHRVSVFDGSVFGYVVSLVYSKSDDLPAQSKRHLVYRCPTVR